MAQPATSEGSVTKELHSSVSAKQSLNPAVRTASANGAGVDLQGYESAEVVIVAGAWSDGTHTMVLQHADANTEGAYAPVAAGELIGTMPVIDHGDKDDMAYFVGYMGAKRYLRVRQAVTGSPSTGALIGAVIVRGHARHQPTA